MPEERVTAYTFALTGYPLPPFITRRRRMIAMELRDALSGLEGMIGISMHGKVMFLHMDSENNAIRAKNRLAYIGFDVSEETHKTILDMRDHSVGFADDEEENE